MIDRTTIKFEDMPKALVYLIEKVEKLDRKLESLNDTIISINQRQNKFRYNFGTKKLKTPIRQEIAESFKHKNSV